MRILAAFLLSAAGLGGQILPTPGATGVSAPGPTLIASTCQGLGINGGTTSAINTTGANYVAVLVAYNGSYTLSDSKGNSFIKAVSEGSVSAYADLWGVNSLGTVASASYTVTITGSTVYASVCISAWSNVVFGWDGHSNYNSSNAASSLNSSNVTPVGTGKNFIITGLSCLEPGSGNISVGGSYVEVSGSPLGLNSGISYCAGMAYLLQTGTATTSATWNQTASLPIVIVIASFY